MLELGTKTDQPTEDNIIDGSDATFMQDVAEASMTRPVIVDFWATWCGPCKQLGPALETAVAETNGALKLVKIDVDRNRGIAGQLKVQSIPTVYTFWQGQPVDGFQGALPPSEIKEFIAKALSFAGDAEDGGLEEALDMADQILAEGAAVDAAQTYAAILEEDPGNARAYNGLIASHLALDDVDQAVMLADNAPAEIAGTPEFDALRARIELAQQAANAGPVAELTAAVEADPDDYQARFDLATALHAAGDVEGAVDQLLELFRRDREWNDGAAKTQLFVVFDALKPQDPIALHGRRRLSSMIFA